MQSPAEGEHPAAKPKSAKSLNFINKKKAMEKLITDNILMMNKIHYAVPSVQHSELQEHAKNSKKLKKLVSMSSMRQSMISTVRNYFVRPNINNYKSGYEDMKSEQKLKSKASASNGHIAYQSLEEAMNKNSLGKMRTRKLGLPQPGLRQEAPLSESDTAAHQVYNDSQSLIQIPEQHSTSDGIAHRTN